MQEECEKFNEELVRRGRDPVKMKDFERRLFVSWVYRNYIQFVCSTCQSSEIRSLLRGGGSTNKRGGGSKDFFDESLLKEFNQRKSKDPQLDHFEYQCKWCKNRVKNGDPLPYEKEDPDKLLNNGYFEAVPEEIAALSEIEVDLISPGLPKITVQRHKKWRSRFFREGSIAYHQDLERAGGMIFSLPRNASQLNILYELYKGKGRQSTFGAINRDRVEKALRKLCQIHPFFRENVQIDEQALSALPENGDITDVVGLNTVEASDDGEPAHRGPEELIEEQRGNRLDKDFEAQISDKDRPVQKVFVLGEHNQLTEQDMLDGDGPIAQHFRD